MQLNNYGDVTVRYTISKEAEKFVYDLFTANVDILYIQEILYVQENRIVFNDFSGDIEDDLSELIDYFRAVGNPVTEINVSYYGDYDGAYRLSNGEVVSVDKEKLSLYDASAEVLMEHAAKKAGNIYRVWMSNEEIDIVVCNAPSLAEAKRLTKQFLTKFSPGEEEETMDFYNFYYYKESICATGCDDNFRETKVINLPSWFDEDSEENEEKCTVKCVCPMCHAHSSIKVNAQAYRSYYNGALLQDAFPDAEYNPMERELIKSGYCPDCQKMLFGTDFSSDRIVTQVR